MFPIHPYPLLFARSSFERCLHSIVQILTDRVFLYALFCNSHNLAQRGHFELLSGATNPHSAIRWAAERTGMHHAGYFSVPSTKDQGHSSSHSCQNISSILRISLMAYLVSFWVYRLVSTGQNTEAESQLSFISPSLHSSPSCSILEGQQGTATWPRQKCSRLVDSLGKKQTWNETR